MHVRHTRVRRARTAALLTGAVVVVGAVVAGVTMAVTTTASRPQLSPDNAAGDGFLVTSAEGVAPAPGSLTAPSPSASADTSGNAEATPAPTSSSTVSIRVYVDYLAPGAKQFELANAAQLSTWVKDGAATLTYYPVAMLTAKSNGTKYSLRAASAAACVATYSPDTVFAFNHALLDKQPDANSDGLSDEDLVHLAQGVGISSVEDVRSCILGGNYLTWAKAATDRAVASIPDTSGLTLSVTPMILVNGKAYQGALDDPKEFSQFVMTTASEAYFRTASPTPTPSVSASPTP